MKVNCGHDECSPYISCQLLTEAELKYEFWFRYRAGLYAESMGADPVAAYEGVDEEWA